VTTAGAVIIQDGRVALIERGSPVAPDYAFPKARVELDETPQDAAVRAVRQAVGQDVTVSRLLAEVQQAGDDDLYFLAEAAPGRMPRPAHAEHDRLAWRSITGLTRLALQPRELALLVEYSGNGWPHDALHLRDRQHRSASAVPV
jgi:ADP-ribose pyrophosphatase YjhB (NUDIX family)